MGKKSVSAILIFSLLVALFALYLPMGTAANKIIIKLSIGLNEVSPEYAGIKKFKEVVESKTGGKYEVQLYPNAQLGDDVRATEAVRLGTLEMTGPSTSPLAGICPELMVFDLPFLFADTKIAYTVLDGPAGQRIMDKLETKGLKALVYWENGFRHITNSAREIKSPADIKGLKIRTMENQIHLAAWRALGANPAPMPFSEVFTAMQQKTIDGQENPIPTIYAQKFYEVQKYCTLTGHVYTPHILLIGKSLWDKFSREDQKIFQEAAYTARDHVRTVSAEMNQEQVKLLQKSGMNVTELSAAQKKVFQNAVQSVYDQFADKIGRATLNDIQMAITKVK